jgi:NAD(P)-dependent dehydrogenase (short-subunit alcohol dehydrogenase family)
MGMKRILITGASRGIGLELARQLLKEGNTVYGTYRNKNSSKNLFQLAENENKLQLVCLDVNSSESIKSAIRTIEANSPSLDQVFNNAGILDWNSLKQISVDSFKEIYETNVIGAFQVSQGALPLLQKGKDPLIINLSSRLGSIGLRGETQLGGAIAYQCSKAALNMLTKQSSIDYLECGVRVISISPGWVKTDMGGLEAKYEVPESVKLILSLLENLPTHSTGIFIGEDGETIPW